MGNNIQYIVKALQISVYLDVYLTEENIHVKYHLKKNSIKLNKKCITFNSSTAVYEITV